MKDKTLDLNDLDHQGETALYKATKNQHRDVIELLLENKADPNKLNLFLMKYFFFFFKYLNFYLIQDDARMARPRCTLQHLLAI